MSKNLNVDRLRLSSSKNLQDGEITEAREAPSVSGDNSLYL